MTKPLTCTRDPTPVRRTRAPSALGDPGRPTPPCVARSGRSRWWGLGLWLGLLLGLAGCGSEPAAPPAEPSAEVTESTKPAPDFEIGRLVGLPSDEAVARNFVKPGHAVTAAMAAIAHKSDLRADLETEVTYADRRPVTVATTQFHLRASRPAVLAKGQRRDLESTFFVPREAVTERASMFLHRLLRDADGGRVVFEDFEGTQSMPAYQYLFVVLAVNPNAYGFLKMTPSVYTTLDEIYDEQGAVLHYRVVLPTVVDRVPLPAHAFSWTMIAYLLWDGLPAESLTPDQQRAMLDWLHWGGQLIVSGPGSLDQLASSFLGPYLPARSGGASELDAESFGPLNDYWSLTPAKPDARRVPVIAPARPVVGVQLRLRSPGVFVAGTGQLVAERRVGRGRIVVTSFGASHPDVVNWTSCDSFLNNVLLRRPRREFTLNRFGRPQLDWAAFPARREDALFTTATRYFARDAGSPRASAPSRRRDELAGRRPMPDRWRPPPASELDWHVDGCEPDEASGIGGWRDGGGVASVAHATLRKAAGISIPRASFVLWVLVAYLVLLVPVNWGFFRLCGRVEWAWAAAPVIALAGAVGVIRLAQLDIGFVRSQTEIDVIEMQPDHPVAHVTRYVALYSSLSSSYELEFDDPAVIARPFPPTPSPDRAWPITFRREQGLQLSGFQVDSNATGFLHTEQLRDMGGALRLVGDSPVAWQIENGTSHDFTQVQIWHRTTAAELLTCRLDTLPAGATLPLAFAGAEQGGAVPDAPTGLAAPTDGAGLDLSEITRLAVEGLQLRPGDVRLVGRLDEPLPGMSIRPAASQARGRSLVVSHLRYGPLPPPRPDVNLLVDVYEPPPASDDAAEAPEPESSGEKSDNQESP